MKALLSPKRSPKTNPDLEHSSRPSGRVTALGKKAKDNGGNGIGKIKWSRRNDQKHLEPNIGGKGEAEDLVYEEEPSQDLSKTHPEMSDMLKTFNEMRLDCQLCDISFLVQGIKFPAHRVILCSSSRWFRSLLSRADKEEDTPIVLDTLDSKAFDLVLGYIYGEKIEASTDVSIWLECKVPKSLVCPLSRKMNLGKFDPSMYGP